MDEVENVDLLLVWILLFFNFSIVFIKITYCTDCGRRHKCKKAKFFDSFDHDFVNLFLVVGEVDDE